MSWLVSLTDSLLRLNLAILKPYIITFMPASVATNVWIITCVDIALCWTSIVWARVSSFSQVDKYTWQMLGLLASRHTRVTHDRSYSKIACDLWCVTLKKSMHASESLHSSVKFDLSSTVLLKGRVLLASVHKTLSMKRLISMCTSFYNLRLSLNYCYK